MQLVSENLPTTKILLTTRLWLADSEADTRFVKSENDIGAYGFIKDMGSNFSERGQK